MPDPLAQVLIVIGLIILLAAGLVIGQFWGLWIQARLSNAHVSMTDLIGMRLRKADLRAIVLGRIRAAQAGLNVSTAELEAHALAGGRVANCITAMIAAANAGRDVPWDAVAEADLAEIDILTLTAEALGVSVAVPVERGPREEQYVRAVQSALPAVQPAPLSGCR